MALSQLLSSNHGSGESKESVSIGFSFIAVRLLMAEDCLLPELYENPLTRKLTLRINILAAKSDPFETLV